MAIPESQQDKDKLPQSRSGVARIFRAFFYSMAGLKSAFVHEAAFRQDVMLGIVLVPLSLWLSFEPMTKVLLNVIWLLLLVTELLNSAIEAIVDMTSPGYHELAKRAKDMGSAAVFIMLTALCIAWGVALYPFIMKRIGV
ncbi:MAG: diacylglycerol kinase [Victivallales bacterium]|nr:diacylglycerol kinase [Victivallales bacterium]